MLAILDIIINKILTKIIDRYIDADRYVHELSLLLLMMHVY